MEQEGQLRADSWRGQDHHHLGRQLGRVQADIRVPLRTRSGRGLADQPVFRLLLHRHVHTRVQTRARQTHENIHWALERG